MIETKEMCSESKQLRDEFLNWQSRLFAACTRGELTAQFHMMLVGDLQKAARDLQAAFAGRPDAN